MKNARPLLTVALGLTLLSACSQAPKQTGLEPQFGTAANDAAVEVALDKSLGHVYVAGNLGQKAFIRQYQRDGSLNWERSSAARAGQLIKTVASDVDASGNVYLAWGYYEDDLPAEPDFIADGTFISKLDKSGKLLWRKSFANVIDMSVDAEGNLYLVGENSVRKHDANGKIVWERQPSNYGARMVDVAVASSGNVVASSSNGMIVKYTSSGAQVFRTTRNFGYKGTNDLALGPNEEIAATSTDNISEGTVVVYSVHAFSPDGKRLWQEQYYGDLADSVSPYVAFDPTGNVYLTTEHWACDGGFVFSGTGEGVTCESGSDTDPERSAILVNKYTPSGALTWSRVINKNRSGVDASTAIAAFSENELYLVGKTVNSVNGQKEGGTDAFVARLDGRGKVAWSR